MRNRTALRLITLLAAFPVLHGSTCSISTGGGSTSPSAEELAAASAGLSAVQALAQSGGAAQNVDGVAGSESGLPVPAAVAVGTCPVVTATLSN